MNDGPFIGLQMRFLPGTRTNIRMVHFAFWTYVNHRIHALCIIHRAKCVTWSAECGVRGEFHALSVLSKSIANHGIMTVIHVEKRYRPITVSIQQFVMPLEGLDCFSWRLWWVVDILRQT